MVAMIGVGLAEQAGLIQALIRKIVLVAPRGAMTAIIVTLGVLSSIASDAGYLVLIPLGAAAFHSIGRHPLAGSGRGVLRRRGGVRRQLLRQADRRHPRRNDQRRGPHRRPRQIDRTDGQLLFRHRVEHRADRASARSSPIGSSSPGSASTKASPPSMTTQGLSAEESRGCLFALIAVRGSPAVLSLADIAARRAAAKPGDRRAHRRLAVHGQPGLSSS